MPKHCSADNFFIPYSISCAKILKYVFFGKFLQHTRSFHAYSAQFCRIICRDFLQGLGLYIRQTATASCCISLVHSASSAIQKRHGTVLYRPSTFHSKFSGKEYLGASQENCCSGQNRTATTLTFENEPKHNLQ